MKSTPTPTAGSYSAPPPQHIIYCGQDSLTRQVFNRQKAATAAGFSELGSRTFLVKIGQ